jgi:hypothetical protein
MNDSEEKLPFVFKCVFCNHCVDRNVSGEPFLPFKNKMVCYDCYLGLIPEIYDMAGAGDGGMIHVLFKMMLSSSFNRKKRTPIRNYRSTLKFLLKKYNFKCVICGKSENLTIDHIKPVSLGGSDKIENLQILCKPCNSKKGCKI